MGRKKSREEKGSKSSETIRDKSEEEDKNNNNNKKDKNMSGDKDERGQKRYADSDINKTEETKRTDMERVRPNMYWP